MSEEEFKFTQADEVPIRAFYGLYAKIIEAFKKQDHDTVELSIPNKNSRAAYMGVLMSLRRNEIEDIRVYQRRGKVYLSKKK